MHSFHEFFLKLRILYSKWKSNNVKTLSKLSSIEIDLETEEAEYNAYMFYQLLEEQTSHSYTLVEDVKVTPELAKIIANLWRDRGVQEAFR